MRHLEESAEESQTGNCTENHSSSVGDGAPTKSVAEEAPNVLDGHESEQNVGNSAEAALLSSCSADAALPVEAALIDVARESVIKSAPKICNRISVIKDGRRELAKVCSVQMDLDRSAAQLVPPGRSSLVIESVPKPCSNDQSERVENRVPGFVQTSRERLQMSRHCPIPKKKMVAYYMNELYADSQAANSNASSDSRSVNFVPTNASRCAKYCDNNLLDLSMKSQGESCY